MVGRHHGALARAVDQRPFLVGLEAVVVAAQPVEEVEDGYVGPRRVLPVVGLEPPVPPVTRTAVLARGGRGGQRLQGSGSDYSGNIAPALDAIAICTGRHGEDLDRPHTAQ
jgi:hypothetical protein